MKKTINHVLSLVSLLCSILILSACDNLAGTHQVAGTSVPATIMPLRNATAVPATPTAIPTADPADVALPPRTVAFFPEADQQQPSNTELVFTIRFSRAMDKESVENALKLQPAVQYNLIWDDEVTLRCSLPPQTSGKKYEVILTKSALAVDGTPLTTSEYTTIKVQESLQVTAVSPADGTIDVRTDALLRYQFNQPVVPLTCVGTARDSKDTCVVPELTIEPATPGRGEWISMSEYRFTPLTSWRSGTEYEVVMSGDFATSSGNLLNSTFSHSFAVVRPELLSIDPPDLRDDIARNKSIQFRFNTAMDVKSTSEAIQIVSGLGEVVAGYGVWTEGDSVYTFRPVTLLEPQMTYFANVGSKSRANSSTPLLNPQQTSFATTTLPSIKSIAPASDAVGVPVSEPVRIAFNGHIDEDVLSSHVVVSSVLGIESPYAYFDNLSGVLTLNWDKQPRIEYCVEIAPGVVDLYGQEIQSGERTCFTTGDLPERLYLPYQEQDVIYLDAVQPSYIDVASINVNEVTFELFALSPDQFATGDVLAGDSLRIWTADLDGEPNTLLTESIALRRLKGVLSTGYYGLHWESIAGEGSSTIVVADATVQMFLASDEAVIWAADIRTGQPISLTTVQLTNQNGLLVAGGTTDETGVARISFSQNAALTESLIAYIGEPDSERFGAVKLDIQDGLMQEGQPSVVFWADRQSSVPGEVIQLSGMAMQYTEGQFSAPSTAFGLELIVRDPQSQVVVRTPLDVDPDGVFKYSYYLRKDLPLGNYVVELYTPEDTTLPVAAITLSVISSSSNSCAISLRQPMPVLYPGEQTILDAELIRCESPIPDTFAIDWRIVSSGADTLAKGDIIVSQASLALSIDLPATVTYQGDALLELAIAEEGSILKTLRVPVIVSPSNVVLDVDAPAYVVGKGRRFAVQVQASTFDQQVLGDLPLTIKMLACEQPKLDIDECAVYVNLDNEQSLVTDATGAASAMFTSPSTGYYVLEVTAEDVSDRIQTVRKLVVVAESDAIFSTASDDIFDTDLLLIADKDTYMRGDTARILVPTPDTGPYTVFVTMVWGDNLTTESFQVDKANPIIDVPLSHIDQNLPFVDTYITLVRAYDEETEYSPAVHGMLRLSISNIDEAPMIGAQLSTDFSSTRYDLVVSLTDDDASSLERNMLVLVQSPAQYSSQHRFSDVALGVYDQISHHQLVISSNERLTNLSTAYSLGAPVNAQDPDFLAFTYSETDTKGVLRLPVDIPCELDEVYITTFTRDNTKLINTVQHLDLDRRLCIETSVPNRVNLGEMSQVSASIYNHTDKPILVTSELTSTDGIVVIDPDQRPELKPGANTTNWEIQVIGPTPELESVEVILSGFEGTALTSGYIRSGPATVPVYASGWLDEPDLPAGVVFGGESSIIVPFTVATPTDITITAASDWLTWLDAKSTVDTSRADAAFVLDSAARVLQVAINRDVVSLSNTGGGTTVPDQSSYLSTSQDDLQRIYIEQLANGSWGLNGIDSNPEVSAYVGYALIRARNSGIRVDENAVNQMLRYLDDYLRRSVEKDAFSSQISWSHSLAFYVLSISGVEWQGQYVQALYQARANLDVAGQAWLALAIGEVDDADPRVLTILNEIATSITANGEIVLSSNVGQERTPFDTTALILKAFAVLSDDERFIRTLVHSTMEHWSTYHALYHRVSALDALYAFAASERTLDEPGRVEVVLNGDVVLTNPTQGLLYQTVQSVLPGQSIVEITGSEPFEDLIFDVSSQSRSLLWRDQSSLMVNNGVWASRQLCALVDSNLSNDTCIPVVHSGIGDTIEVRNTIILAETQTWLKIVAPIPSAGLYVNELDISANLAGDAQVWYRTEDGLLTMIIDSLPAGTYSFDFEVQIQATGTSVVLPLQVWSLYESNILATSGTAVLYSIDQ